jgi:hypothetical protein
MTSVEKELPSGKNVCCGGTVATPGALELRWIVMPLAGAGPERAITKESCVAPTIVMLGGLKVRVAVTWAATLAVV